jgi:hypothetical protein
VASDPWRNPALELAQAVAARKTGRPQHRRRRPTRRQFLVRRLVAGVVTVGALGLLGGAVYSVSGMLPGRKAGAVAAPTTSTSTSTVPAPEPGGGQTLFPSHRLVAFYGAPGRPRLGVLGEGPPDALWPRLSEAAAPFASPQVTVVPSYELVAFLAQAAPGPVGAYSEQIPASQIDLYLQAVHAHGGMLILDIQPGRTDLLTDAQALEPWLVHPDVGLALDPEWELAAGQVPNKQVGRTNATEINQVADWLQQLTVAKHLPQKLLMIHQFLASTVTDKALVNPQPNLAIVFNMDGFGTTANKASVYKYLATDSRWPLGYKLFYTRDRPVQTPAEVLSLAPLPAIVEYE